MLFIGLFYIGLPTFLLLVLAFKSQPTKLLWGLTVMLAMVSILFLWTIARWEIVSIYFRPVFPVLLIIAAAYSYKKIDAEKMPTKGIYKMTIILNAVVIFMMTTFCFLALRGYRVPLNTVALQSPLRDGDFIVLHGGSRPMINAHFHVNPQNYAVDIVALDQWGRRANSIAGGENLHDYHIYGLNVYSPCNGKVLIAVNQFDDRTPPTVDTKNIAGNHVLIQCGENELLLAHLQKDSISVQVGDNVDNNSVIGKVGNTGNSSEPHLHMHLERGGEENTILNGKGIPFTIHNKFLLRGDRI